MQTSQISKAETSLEAPKIEPAALNALKSGLAACSSAANAPKLSHALIAVWSRVFATCDMKGITGEEVDNAFIRHKQQSKWWPQEFEILENIREARLAKVAARKREIDQREALPATAKSPEQMEAERIARAEIRAAMRFGARKLMDLPKQVIPSEAEDVIITKADLDRRDAMIAQLRAGR